MKYFLLLLLALLTCFIALDLLKAKKTLKIVITIDIIMVVMILTVDRHQLPVIYYLLFLLSLLIYGYLLSGTILKTRFIHGRNFRFALILVVICLSIKAMDLFEGSFCPLNHTYGINASRFVQVVGFAVCINFIVDEIKLLVNND